MGDSDYRFSRHEAIQRLVNQLLRSGVEILSGFIENQNGRVPDHRARNGNALALATGERHATFADDGVVPLRSINSEAFASSAARMISLRVASGLP